MRLIDADVHECWACVHNNCGCDTWCEYGEAFELREDVKNAPTIKAVLVEVVNRVVMDLNKKERECSERRAAYYSEDKKYRAYIQLGKAEAYRDVIEMLGKKV